MKQTQAQWVIQELKANGEVTRNQALSRYISRLGAIACDLKANGWQLEGFNRDGDYVYKLIDRPKDRKIVLEPVEKDGRVVSWIKRTILV